MLHCTFENHHQASLRHVTVNTLVMRNQQVLLGLRGMFHGKPILESGKWSMLGGFMERDEDIFEAAEREVKEESGWSISNLEVFMVNHTPHRTGEDRQNVEFVFIAQAQAQLSQPDEEVKQLSWFELDQLPPQSQVAFDHYQALELLQRHVASPFTLPIWIGSKYRYVA